MDTHSQEFKQFCDQSRVQYTDANYKQMRQYVIRKYELTDSPDTLVKSHFYSSVFFDICADGKPLREYLTFEPEPTPPPPVDRRSDFNKLADAGILKSNHYSHSAMVKDEADRASRLAAERKQRSINNRRAELERGVAEAQSTTVYIKNGPLSGRIDYAETGRAQAAATQKAQAALNAFNQQNPPGGN